MAFEMFLKIGDVKGESLDKALKEWIDVRSFSFGEHNSGSAQVGGAGGAGKATFEDFRFTTGHGRHAVPLMKAVALGTHFPTAELRLRTAGEAPFEFLTIKLQEVLVTSYDLGGADGVDVPSEAISLSYAKIEVKSRSQADKGTPGQELTFAFDVAANISA
jgi:type VI secretion system secreted protein Hcp